LQTNLAYFIHKDFTMNNMIHSYNTRIKNDLHFGTVNANLGKRSLKFKASNVWNCLPTSI